MVNLSHILNACNPKKGTTPIKKYGPLGSLIIVLLTLTGELLQTLPPNKIVQALFVLLAAACGYILGAHFTQPNEED